MIARECLLAAESLCQRYRLDALTDFLSSCQRFSEETLLNVAVFGRFKAGKTSFLNCLIGRPMLPVGVIPVTSVVTELQYGPREHAEVHFEDGRSEDVPLQCIGEFIAEAENPENAKRVTAVRVELPCLERYRSIRFVDTPGLESAFAHNTNTSLDWLPNTGLALVAVSVDPPLSQHDIELIQRLSRYTPNVGVLLTKADLLDADERGQVCEFVRERLAACGNGGVPVFPYSIRAGFENLRADLDQRLLGTDASGQRTKILAHKLDSLLAECAEYLNVALRAARVADSERHHLRDKVLGSREMVDEARLTLKLIVRHEAGALRSSYEALLAQEEEPMRHRLAAQLKSEFPAWKRSLSYALDRFDQWLESRMAEEMSVLSEQHRDEFIEPARRAGRRLSEAVQDFRNRLSERILDALGVPLRTGDPEPERIEPRSPDVRVGRIFDHHWELISALIPMTLAGGAVHRHFRRKTGAAVFTHLSRLTSQWEDVVREEILRLEKDALGRLNRLVATIETVIAPAGLEAGRIEEDLREIEQLRRRLQSQ